VPGGDRHTPCGDLEWLELADRQLAEAGGCLAEQPGELLERFWLGFVLGEVEFDEITQHWRVAARLVVADAVEGASERLSGGYDAQADIAWLRFDGYDPGIAVTEKAGYGVRELDIVHRGVTDRERLWPQAWWRRVRPIVRLRPSCASRPAVEYSLADLFPDVGVCSGHELSAGLSAPQP
jgi:hypothetical protein